MIACLVCNKSFKQITHNHLIAHQMSVADYKKQFPKAALQDDSIIMRGERNPFFGRKHSEELKQWQRDHFSGKSMSEETKYKLSLLWKDPNGTYRKMMRSETYRKTLSQSLKSWWDNADDNQIRDRFERIRQTNELRGRWISNDDREPFEAYRNQIRTLSEATFVLHFYELPNAHLRGKGYELDHILSIYDGFKHAVPVDVMSHILNLRMISSHENKSKGRNSLKTPAQLISEVQNEK